MIQKITIAIVMAVLCLNFWEKEQPQTAAIKTFQVGEQLPESFWLKRHKVIRDGKETSECLEIYRGKPIILDFWATWCSSCITKFNLLDSAAHAYKLSVILVNSQESGDTFEKINRCLSVVGAGHLKLPTIYADSLLQGYFPHRLLPHYVWIDASGRIQAITGIVQLNKNSLEIFAAEHKRPLNQKKNVNLNAPKK